MLLYLARLDLSLREICVEWFEIEGSLDSGGFPLTTISKSKIDRMVTTRLPTETGELRLSLYQNGRDNKEHLALIKGEVTGQHNVLVRIHSECFTGDVLGSERCDCGEQLERALTMIEQEGCGAIIYLRQEGRGIGLLEKLKAYNLQDMGYDTVDANRLLGHAADGRDYSLAAHILEDLDIRSVRLLTNNPAKIDGLVEHGIEVCDRVPIRTPVKAENAAYMKTKAERLRHLLEPDAIEADIHLALAEARPSAAIDPSPARITTLAPTPTARNGNGHGHGASDHAPWIGDLLDGAEDFRLQQGRPFVTLSYAQSIDGCIAAQANQPLALSGSESLSLTHQLRAAHDAILVGIGTVLADNPRLTVRLIEADNPQPVVLDSRLRFPPDARLLAKASPWIVTTEDASLQRQRDLEAVGAMVLRLPTAASGRIDLDQLLAQLAERGINSLMVEGGATVITSFLSSRHIDHLVLTVAPTLVGGLAAVGRCNTEDGHPMPRLRSPHYTQLGQDLIVRGDPEWF